MYHSLGGGVMDESNAIYCIVELLFSGLKVSFILLLDGNNLQQSSSPFTVHFSDIFHEKLSTKLDFFQTFRVSNRYSNIFFLSQFLIYSVFFYLQCNLIEKLEYNLHENSEKRSHKCDEDSRSRVLAVVACLIVHCPPGVPEVIKSRGEKNVPS